MIFQTRVIFADKVGKNWTTTMTKLKIIQKCKTYITTNVIKSEDN